MVYVKKMLFLFMQNLLPLMKRIIIEYRVNNIQ